MRHIKNNLSSEFMVIIRVSPPYFKWCRRSQYIDFKAFHILLQADALSVSNCYKIKTIDGYYIWWILQIAPSTMVPIVAMRGKDGAQ